MSAIAFPSCCIRDTVGDRVGINVGADVGINVGADVGINVGADVSINVGADVGINVGADVGIDVGADVGADIQEEVIDNHFLVRNKLDSFYHHISAFIRGCLNVTSILF